MSEQPTPHEGQQVDPQLAAAIEEALSGDGDSTLPAEGQAHEASESAPEAASEEVDPLSAALAAQAQAEDALARARADLYNLQQEYQGFVRRSREGAAGHREAGAQGVVEALIPVLDEIELARTHGDLTGPFEAMATKLETILSDKFSLTRFGQAGEVFDPLLHEALMATESSEVSEPTVAVVLQPGYKLGERVVRAARVQVANPA